jgi:predicted RNA binding protein YcfA (HicA-like mRNA interferase family)
MASYYRQLIELPRKNGWVLDRQGKGSHEIWKHATSGRKVSVPYDCNVRHTANGILKDAGIVDKL